MAHQLRFSLQSFLRYAARRLRDPINRERFTVICRSCQRVVPAGTTEFPFHSLPVRCRLCGAAYTYRPSEVALRTPHALVRHQEKLEFLRQKRRPKNPAGLSIVPRPESAGGGGHARSA